MTKSAQLTFPFSINATNYNAIGITNHLLAAAECGDLTPLNRLESEFGGVGYDTKVAKTALKAGHLEFWRKFVILSRWECIVIESGALCTWTGHMYPIWDLLSSEIGDQMKYQALKIALDEYLPSLPSRDEFITGDEDVYYVDHRVILPPHRYSIWCLENFREFPKTAYGDTAINMIMDDGNQDMIQLLIDHGIKFSLRHLQRIVLRYQRDLYDLVYNNLRPHIDRDHIPISCQYHDSPNDSELLEKIALAARDAHYRQSESLDDLIKFLECNERLINMLPATVEFFQKVLDGHDFTEQRRDLIADWFYSFCKRPNRVGSNIPKALQISQILLERFKDTIDMNTKFVLDFPSMSRDELMRSHLRKGKQVEEIPEDERFVDDEYPMFPEPDDNDDYADWVKRVGHGYFEDFLDCGHDEVDSSIDHREHSECSDDEEHGSQDDDEREDSEYNNEEYLESDGHQEDVDHSYDDENIGVSDYYEENAEYTSDEDYGEYDTDQEDIERSYDEDNGENGADEQREIEYVTDEKIGDNRHESSQDESVQDSGCAGNADFQFADTSGNLAKDRGDRNAVGHKA